MKFSKKSIAILSLSGLATLIYISGIETLSAFMGWWNHGTVPDGTFLGQFIHHSRWGAIMIVVGSIFLWLSANNTQYAKWDIWYYILIVAGFALIFHHLSTEQCMSVVGGFCTGVN